MDRRTPRPDIKQERRRPPLAAFVLALIVVVAGGAVTGYAFLGGASKSGQSPSLTTQSGGAALRACKTPELDGPDNGVRSWRGPGNLSFGSWPLHLVMRGVFGPATAEPDGALDAFQACGAAEGSLRVVRIDPAGHVTAVSQLFRSAALLESGLVSDGTKLYLVTARLDLSGDSEPPYSMTAYELSDSNLSVVARLSLGRGDGAHLAVGNFGGRRTVLCATGSSLLEIANGPAGTLTASPLLSVEPSVITHLEPAGVNGFVFSALPPGAPEAQSLGRLEVVSARGSVVRMTLPPGESVQSLAVVGRHVFYAAGSYTTNIYMATLPGLSSVHRIRPSVGETLGDVGLASGRRALLVYSPTSIGCLDGRTSRLLAAQSALPAASGGDISALVRTASATFAEDGSGLVELVTPRACS